MRIGAAVEGDLKKIVGESIDVMSIVVSDSVNRATTGLQAEMRKQTEAAGLGRDLSKAWQKKQYPAKRPSMSAAGWVYSKSRRIHDAFSMARTITARGGRYLAIPLAGAIKRNWHLGGKGGLRGAKPRKWSDFGQVLKLPGVAWLPMANGSVLIALRGPKGKRGEPLFLLTRAVRLKGGLDLVGPPQRWLDALFTDLQSQLGR